MIQVAIHKASMRVKIYQFSLFGFLNVTKFDVQAKRLTSFGRRLPDIETLLHCTQDNSIINARVIVLVQLNAEHMAKKQ